MNEIILTETPNRQLFLEIGSYMEKELKMTFGMKLTGLDQSYWDFKINDHAATLHFEQYSGITLSLSKSSKPSEETLNLTFFIAEVVKKKFKL